jgi:hypothetical protein
MQIPYVTSQRTYLQSVICTETTCLEYIIECTSLDALTVTLSSGLSILIINGDEVPTVPVFISITKKTYFSLFHLCVCVCVLRRATIDIDAITGTARR